MKRILFLAVLVSTSVGCLGSDFADSIEGSWRLSSGTVDGEEIPLVETHPITIDFEDGEVTGTASCNGYGGSYRLTGAAIEFDPLVMTEMACSPQEVMVAEMMYSEALTRVTTVVLDDGLALRGSGVELMFARGDDAVE